MATEGGKMAFRHLVLVLGVALLGACGSLNITLPLPDGLPSSAPSASPSPTPSSPVTATNLTGAWIFGSDQEPPAGPVVECNPFKLWNLTQTGDQLKGSVEACLGP